MVSLFCPLCNFTCFVASCWLLLHIVFCYYFMLLLFFSSVTYCWCCFFTLVLFCCASVALHIDVVSCWCSMIVLLLHTGVITTHWCYYVVLCQWCFTLVMLLLFRSSVANASCWWCCFTLVLLMLFHTNVSQWWCCFYFALMVVFHISGVASTLCYCYRFVIFHTSTSHWWHCFYVMLVAVLCANGITLSFNKVVFTLCSCCWCSTLLLLLCIGAIVMHQCFTLLWCCYFDQVPTSLNPIVASPWWCYFTLMLLLFLWLKWYLPPSCHVQVGPWNLEHQTFNKI